MSGKRKRDYRKVLKAIKRLTKERKLEKFVLDFEQALWRAIPSVFPGVLNPRVFVSLGTMHLEENPRYWSSPCIQE
jgi:hypothetical protein